MSNKKNRVLKRSPSLESSASLIVASNRGPVSSIPEASDLPGELYNCSAVLIHCTRHNRIGLQKINNRKGLFMPIAAVFPNESMEQNIRAKLKQVLQSPKDKTPRGYVPFGSLDIIHIFRLAVPVINSFIERYMFFTRIPEKDGACCTSAANLTWMDIKEASNPTSEVIWGPEVEAFVDVYCSSSDSPVGPSMITEIGLKEARKLVPRDGKDTAHVILTRAAGYSEADIMRAYLEFIQHTYPSQYMNYMSFVDYMSSINFFADDKAKKDAQHYFRAFCANNTDWISFQDFLSGMAAADSKTQHGSSTGELRVGYIFRFYDFNNDQKLEYKEVSRLVFDALRAKKEPHDEKALEAALLQVYKALKIAPKTPLDSAKTKEAVGSMILRGTSSLFRTSVSFKKCANSTSLQYSPIDLNYTTVEDLMSNGTSSSKTKCPTCREKKYTVAGHSVTLTSEGLVTGPKIVEEDDAKKIPADRRKMSAEVFELNLANLALDIIREYAEALKILVGSSRSPKKAKNYLSENDKGGLCEKFMKLCDQVETLFKKDARVLKIQSPCYVFGDIHGNLHDLLLYERLLWRKGTYLEPGSYLFLGDYVDRGPNSLEVIVYLFSMKILSPGKVFLLRGNHEVRGVNKTFTFHSELITKFGENYGAILWERFNKVFDCIPICAVIDETIFCAHGGIPTSVGKLEELRSMPVPMSDPENQFPAAHEMLWNDPINAAENAEIMELMRSQTDNATMLNAANAGFLPNTKRGTAFYFAEEAIRVFLKNNGLSHVIRAHEVCQAGFQFHHHGKVCTIFSSSKYGNGLNESACVFVDQQKLRLMKFDTNI